jgi:hypothetical protein
MALFILGCFYAQDILNWAMAGIKLSNAILDGAAIF